MAALYASSLFLTLAVAMPGAAPWIGPMPTPMGMMATAGMSPRPTPAPGSDGIPQELRRRANYQYPPPENWCGFVNGEYSSQLTCEPGLTCVNSEAALGCCTATTGLCTDLYTTCLNFGDLCNNACERDPNIKKCSLAALPFCNTFRFPGATYLYNCESTVAVPYSVEFLNDFYVSAIGSTLATDTANPFGKVTVTRGTAVAPTGTTSPSNNNNNNNNSNDDDDAKKGGLSQGAIDGIAAAAAIVGVAILAIIAFFLVRMRRKRRMAAATAAYPNNPPPQQQPPPMQQQVPMQQQAPPPKAFDGYQSVPQQDQQLPPKYPSPDAQPQQQQQNTGYFPPPGATSHISPQPTGTSGSHPPQSPVSAPSIYDQQQQGGQRQSYYKPPLSPAITEVDGTMGNPGVPPGAHQHGYGHANEVDGTMGNPGIPSGGHGIAHQMQPGGSPSAMEIDGNMRASMNRPFDSGGAYEMGPGGR